MRSVFLLALAVVLSAALSAQSTSTFFSTFDAERGSVVTPAAGGNLWLGGQKDERVLLAKLNPEGKVLDKHTIGFDGLNLDGEHLTDLFEESDGTLVGCGNFEGDNLGRGFVFRYNPATRQTLWAHIVRSGLIDYLHGITQLGPGGDYVLYGSSHTVVGDDAELLQISRTTGQIVPGKAKRFGVGPSDNILQTVYHNGALYTCGRFTGTEPYPPARMRNAVCKIDTATLEPIWTRLGPLPTSSSGQFHGRDLIIDNGAILSTFSGDHQSPDLDKSEIYLQKNDLDGNVLWIRQYKLPAFSHEFAEEIISLSDGYLLYGHDIRADTSRLFLLKTDKEGNAITAVIINFDENDEFPEIPARSKILRFGDALFFTALSQNNLGQTQGILVKADLNGMLNDSCDFFQKTPVTFSTWTPAVSQLFLPTVTASAATLTAATISQNTPSLTFEKKCGATGTCPNLPDLRVILDSVTCTNGNSRLHYTVCNVGGQPYDGPFFLLFYDKNPLTGPANLVTAEIWSSDDPILAGDCVSSWGIHSDPAGQPPFELDTFTRLYALIGATFAVQPPIPISGFPYSPNKPECSYLNNLDSISIPPNLCGDCKTPVTFVKKLGTPQRRELAFSMCASADGNVYVAGKQGENPMIAKITTRGEQLWVRNFPPINPNEPIEWASIIEDSDGKIVVCGTEGASPSNRRAIAMRYDPVAGAVLWYKRYHSDKPVGVAIVEKSPGGDFVLQVNYQTVGSGGVSAQAQFFTLKRADGNTTGSSVGYESIGTNITLANTVMNNGKLYAVGSWGIKATDEVRPFFAKISPTTFLPEWAYLSIPDTNSGAARWMPPADVGFEGDFAVIAGSGHLNPLTPTENIFVYLQKYKQDGSLVWTKRYDMAMIPEELVMIDNGYIVFGRMVGTNRFGMLKTDFNGNFLRAAVLDAAPTSPNNVGFVSRQGLALLLPLQLLMLDHTWENNESDLVLLRTDWNFGLDDDCDLLQTVQVGSSTLAATTEPALFSIGSNTPASAALPATAVFQTDSLPLRKLCPRCPCEGQPDVSFGVTGIQCAADSTHVFKTKTCNTGDAATPTPVEVVFYDKNPLTEAATALWSITVNQPVGSGGCAETTESLPAVAAQYGKIYTFAGVPIGTPTPIDLALLAANAGFPDCHWGNNLDSFTVHAPVCDGCENPTTFFKTMGRVDQAELGYSLCTATDGTVYMAGRQGKNPMLAKMTPNGEMLWVRNFPAGSAPFNEIVELVEIIEDSEGKLVLCGTEGQSPNTRMAVAMRYDPVADEVLWFKRYPEQNPQSLGIFEKTPGGNFVTYAFSDELFPGGPPFGSYYKARSHVWEINRATGEVVPPLLTYFAGTPSVYFQDMVHHNGSLYVAGSWRNPDVPNSGRPILAKLSATDAAPEWIFGVLPDPVIPFQFLGFNNILADGDHLLVMGYGATDLNTPAQKNYLFLSKYTLDGTLLWMKNYDANIAAEDILALPEGYVIFGRTQGNSWVLFKTDKDGNLLKAQKLTMPTASGTTFRYFRQNQLLRLPNHLLVVDDFKDGSFEDIVLFKTDLDLNFDAACGLAQPMPINATVLSPKKSEIFTTFETYLMAAANTETTFVADSLRITQLCPQCPCTDKPDIDCQVVNLACSGTDTYVANLRICNTGFVNAPAGFNLTFYDKNPLAGAAVPLFSAAVPVQPGFGDCAEYALPLGFDPKGYAQIFTLAGVWSDAQTPVVLDDFPYPNGYAECDYANNLDSFAVQLPNCSSDSCQPSTFIKMLGAVNKVENYSAMRATPDGNLYLAGQKDARTAICKITPNGEFLWSRSFATTPYEQVVLAEIIVDSEGMIVGSGRKGDGAAAKGFAFRYDPAANKMLWAQQFDSDRPVEGGILEKTPGGNYVLYQTPTFGDSTKLRAEVLELERGTGQIVPGFAKRYNFSNFRQSFSAMVAHGGALYGMGHVVGLFNARRMVVTKIDAATGNVIWAKSAHHGWTQPATFRGVDMIVDGNSLLTLYYGNETSYTMDERPGSAFPAFLQKSTLEGEVLWVKKFSVHIRPKELRAVSDGYIILGSDFDRLMVKTDKEGNVLVATRLSNPPIGNTGNGERQNQIEQIGSRLFFSDHAIDFHNQEDQPTLFYCVDMNLDLEFDCLRYGNITVKDSLLNYPTSTYPQTVVASPASQQSVVTAFIDDKVRVRETCPDCPDLTCTDKPDITFQIESVGCDSTAFVTYRVCNTGKQPFIGTLQVGVYDSNPMTTAATLLDLFFLPNLNLPADSCLTGTLQNLVYWGNYSQVYTVAGIDSGPSTPIDPAGFPYNGIAECDYANNLDSINFQYPAAPPKPDLGPDRMLCVGQNATLDAGAGFVFYKWSNGQTAQTVAVNSTGIYRVEATDACGRTLHDTVSVTVLPPIAPTTVTIQFYPGDTVILAGVPYTQPGTIMQTLKTINGCDSVVTYILQRVITNLDLVCPPDLTVTVAASASSAPVNYSLPAAATDCPVPGIALTRLQGPPSGGTFPLGTTQVCYEAANECGIRDTCCFRVTVQKAAADDTACDVKAPSGSCIKYEILSVRLDSLGRPRYRFRLTNTCASPLRYAYFQLPNGMTAKAPLEGATYTAPGGNTYLVRNPNAAPFHSVRFKPLSGNLNNGQSDIFEYTLPKQAQPAFILVSVKLADGSTYDAHLNTFACPVQPYVASAQEPVAQERNATTPATMVSVRPNPTNGLLFVEITGSQNQAARIQVLNTQGQLVLEGEHFPGKAMLLPDGLANGLYFLLVQPVAGGVQSAARFVLER